MAVQVDQAALAEKVAMEDPAVTVLPASVGKDWEKEELVVRPALAGWAEREVEAVMAGQVGKGHHSRLSFPALISVG